MANGTYVKRQKLCIVVALVILLFSAFSLGFVMNDEIYFELFPTSHDQSILHDFFQIMPCPAPIYLFELQRVQKAS